MKTRGRGGRGGRGGSGEVEEEGREKGEGGRWYRNASARYSSMETGP